MPFAIETEGLVKIFRTFWSGKEVRAVDGITLSVEQGSTFGLLGPNGAGKTTFVKLLLSCAHATKGAQPSSGATRARPKPGGLSATCLKTTGSPPT